MLAGTSPSNPVLSGLVAALASFALTATTATGQTPAEPPDVAKLEVRQIVRQLDDERIAVRDQAEQKLIELGPPVLPWLPEIAENMSEEVKHRLTRVRQKIERSEAEQATRATHVTLSAQAMLLSLVLAKIEQQTGNKLSFGDPMGEQLNETPINIDFDDTLFWPALDQVLDQAKLTVYHYSQESALSLRPQDPGQLPRHGRASYDGPFRLEVLRARAVRDLRSPANRSLKLEIEFAWEPRLSPIALNLPLKDIRAEDEQGNILPVSGPDVVLPVEIHPGSSAVELEIPFELPSRRSTKISKLKGTLQVLVPGRVEKFRFDNIEAADRVEKRKGGVTVVLDRVRKNNDLWDVLMRVRYDQATGALESHRGWVYRNARYILDSQGERIEDLADETTGQSDTEISFAFAFDLLDGPQGLSFVYETPAVILRMPVSFELKDIDLP